MKKQNAMKFNVVTGNLQLEKISNEMSVGYSLLIEGNQYYLMRFFLFDKYFFIVKNNDSVSNYTVFGSKHPNEPIFKNPVGTATLRPESKLFLEVNIPLIGLPIYMSLFPS